MIIRVRSSVGMWRIALSDSPTLTFADLKEAIAAQQHISRDALRLSRDATEEGEYIDDALLLIDAGIAHGSLVFLLGRHEKQVVPQSYVGEGGVIVGAGTKIVTSSDRSTPEISSGKSSPEVAKSNAVPAPLALPSEQKEADALSWGPPSPEVRAPIAVRNMTLLGDDNDDEEEEDEHVVESDNEAIAAALAAGVPSYEIELMMRQMHRSSTDNKRRVAADRSVRKASDDVAEQVRALLAMDINSTSNHNPSIRAAPPVAQEEIDEGSDDAEAALQAAILASMSKSNDNINSSERSTRLPRPTHSTRHADAKHSSAAPPAKHQPVAKEKSSMVVTGQSVRKPPALLPDDNTAPPPFRLPKPSAKNNIKALPKRIPQPSAAEEKKRSAPLDRVESKRPQQPQMRVSLHDDISVDDDLRLAMELSLMEEQQETAKQKESKKHHSISKNRQSLPAAINEQQQEEELMRYDDNSAYRDNVLSADDSAIDDPDVAAAIALSLAEEAERKKKQTPAHYDDNPPHAFYYEDDELLAKALSESLNG